MRPIIWASVVACLEENLILTIELFGVIITWHVRADKVIRSGLSRLLLF